MAMNKKRDYEVSIWSLQDEFITVLKAAYLENKGQISEPDMRLKTDQTFEFSFSIPMYIYRGAERIENPIWYNTRNGIIITNMRKVKVIFNKNTEVEKVFEFKIITVTERHEDNQLYCDVDCEGLAFHELGKTGYKISLSSQQFYDEDYEWFTMSEEERGDKPKPVANLQYWVNKFLKPYNEHKAHLDANEWYYEVKMDWSNYKDQDKRASDKVYEEPYVSSWDEDLKPLKVENYIEKERMLDLEESNKYNLTQEIAETFGVFCRYEYEYDDNYHIIARKVVFYNNYFQESQGYIGINYPYDTDSVRREIDSSDLTTKMYIKPANNESSISGWSTIMNVEANKSLEDYILNFDYCYEIGAITKEQYEAIAVYEKKLRKINLELIPLDQTIESLQQQLPEADAAVTFYTNALQLDKERLAVSTKLFDSLTNGEGLISVTAANPTTAVLLEDSSKSNDSYYFNIKAQGIDPTSLHIYKTINYAETDESERLKNEIFTGEAVYDEFGNLSKITNIFLGPGDSKIVYLTYKYSPKGYYERVKNTWTNRLNNDTGELAAAEATQKNLNDTLNEKQERKAKLLAEQQELRHEFECLMGPALREGYWLPEEFNDYGDNYIDTFAIDLSDSAETVGDSTLAKFFWDNEAFDEEQKGYYKIGVELTEKPYPYICLSNTTISKITEEGWWDKLSLIFKTTPLKDNNNEENASDNNNTNSDSNTEENTDNNINSGSNNEEDTSNANTDSEKTITLNYRDYHCFSLGSQVQLAFMHDELENTITPILLITGAETLTDDEIKMMSTYYNLGLITTDTADQQYKLNFAPIGLIADDRLIVPKDNQLPVIVYPRIEINSLFLKNADDQLTIRYNGENLERYKDYSALIREQKYYLTLNDKVLLSKSLISDTEPSEEKKNNQLLVKFALSNADTSIYLDAIQILKENSKPKVTYEVALKSVNKKLLYNIYDKLACIVNINDTDLKFENVQGYISELELDLENENNDSITINNYKNKFEDLFSSIVAQTEAMKKSEYTIGLASSLFMSDGQLSGVKIQDSLRKVDLDYAFNNGKLTVDEKNGIVGLSDTGVVAMRGGGIFTATEQDHNGNWIWNTGITPQGINADLITTGQLDTNLIKIYSGDRAQFQFNSDGIYAYRTFLQDYQVESDDNKTVIDTKIKENSIDGYDPAQYIVFNSDGLALKLEKGALILNGNKTAFIPITQPVTRVKLGWDGLTLRDLENKPTLYTDPNSGDLYLRGTVYADSFQILPNENSAPTSVRTLDQYLSENVIGSAITNQVKTLVEQMLTSDDNAISHGIHAALDNVVTIVDAIDRQNESWEVNENVALYTKFYSALARLVSPSTYSSTEAPEKFRMGDIWKQEDGNGKVIATYLAMSDPTTISSSDNKKCWNRIYNGRIESIEGAKLEVDANSGKIDMSANGIQLTGNEVVNIGGATINLGGSAINILATSAVEDGPHITTGEDNNFKAYASAVTIAKDGIDMYSDGHIRLGTIDAGENELSGLFLEKNQIILGRGTLSDNNNNNNNNDNENNGSQLTFNEGLLINEEAIELKSKGIITRIAGDEFIISTIGNNNVPKQQFHLDKEHILLGSYTDNNNNNNNEISLGGLSGVLVRKDGIWMATTSDENTSGVVAITPKQIFLGQVNGATAEVENGSFIALADSQLRLGAATELFVNTGNIGIYSQGRNRSTTTNGEYVDMDYTIVEEGGGSEQVYFRLGAATNPRLVATDTTFYVRGQIVADNLLVGKYELVEGKVELTDYESLADAVDTAIGANVESTVATAVGTYITNNNIRGQLTYTSKPSNQNYKEGDLWYETNADTGEVLIRKATKNKDGNFKLSDWQVLRRLSGYRTFTGPSAPAEAVPGDVWYQQDNTDGLVIWRKTLDGGWSEVKTIAPEGAQIFTITGDNNANKWPIAYRQGDILYDMSASNVVAYKATRDSDWFEVTTANNIINTMDSINNTGQLPEEVVDGMYCIYTATGENNQEYDAICQGVGDGWSNPWHVELNYNEPSPYSKGTWWYNGKILYFAQAKSNDESGWKIIQNPGQKTFTSSNPPTGDIQEGDLWYNTSGSSIELSRYVGNKWVTINFPTEGVQTFYTDYTDAEPSTYSIGDVWYQKQRDNTYVIHVAVANNEIEGSNKWQRIDLPIGNDNHLQHLFYGETEPPNFEENDLWYKPVSGRGAKFELYVACVVDFDDTWTDYSVDNGIIAYSFYSSDNRTYNIGDYVIIPETDDREVLTGKYTIYRCITQVNEGTIIELDNDLYWQPLTNQICHFTPDIDTKPDGWLVNDYWIFDQSPTSEHYYSKIYKAHRSKENSTKLEWIIYTYPEMKGAKLAVNADEGYIDINATDEINIISTPTPGSFNNNAVQEGGIINIGGATVNIAATSKLTFGYEGSNNELSSYVIIDNKGIRMNADADLIMNAGNIVQITSNNFNNNYIQFGRKITKIDDNTTITTAALEINDSGIFANTASFDTCYISGMRALTQNYVTYPILYSNDPEQPEIPEGFTYAIWLHPQSTQNISETTSTTWTRQYVSLQADTQKISKVVNKPANKKIYTFNSQPTRVSGEEISAPTNVKYTLRMALTVIADRESSTTTTGGTAKVSFTTANNITLTQNVIVTLMPGQKTTSETIYVSTTLENGEVDEAFGSVTVSAQWLYTNNPGLYATGHLVVALERTRTVSSSTTQTGSREGVPLIASLITK